MLTVATANTQEARLFNSDEGLRPLAERGTDILLLQEVLGMASVDVEQRLNHWGFDLAHLVGEMGLAIAIARDGVVLSDVSPAEITVVDAPRETHITKRLPGMATRARQRGMLAAKLTSIDGTELTVATAHPIVFARRFVRMRQMRDLSAAFKEPFFEGALVLGMDANHYPRPMAIDHWLVSTNGLRRVALQEPTWPIQGSKHEWFTHVPFIRKLAVDAELDALLYRGLELQSHEVVDIASDHRAIVARFETTHG